MQTKAISEHYTKVQISSCFYLNEDDIFNLKKLINHRRQISKEMINTSNLDAFNHLKNQYDYCDTQIKLLLSL